MKYIPNAISSRVARQALVARKNSPTILFGAGIVGFGATVVLASRATLKLDEVLQKTEKHIHEAKTALEVVDTKGAHLYSEEDYKKDLATIYVLTAVEITKLYAPAITIGIISVGCLSRSHNILNKRNAAVTAAYAALEKGFKEYRERVIEEVGGDREEQIYYGSQTIQVEEEGKDGKTKEVARTVARKGEPSIYARFFDEGSKNWSKEPEYNSLFIKCQQNWANDLLVSRGHVFLNEVYDMLDIPRTKAGQVVGWVVSRDGGDNYIDFGVFDGKTQEIRDFVNGLEGSILLDFNVDGIIYDKI